MFPKYSIENFLLLVSYGPNAIIRLTQWLTDSQTPRYQPRFSPFLPKIFAFKQIWPELSAFKVSRIKNLPVMDDIDIKINLYTGGIRSLTY